MIKKGLIVGIANLILGMGINWFIGKFFSAISSEYQNIAMFRPWNDPLMMVYFAYPFILGIVLAYLWEKVKRPRPFAFAELYFVIATIPGMFITYTSFQVSLGMVILWSITGFVQAYVAGFVFNKSK